MADIEKLIADAVEKKIGELAAEKAAATVAAEPKRKMVFDGGDSRLNGSKFAGRNIEKADLAFLHNILADNSAKGGRGPSEYLTNACKAMDTAETGYGSELVGAQYDNMLWDAARANSVVAPLIPQIEMTQPTLYVPVAADLPEMLLVSESTANNASNYATSKTGFNRVTLTAKKMVIHQMWSGELEEDSLIPFVAELRAQMAQSIGYYLDSAILNGDTTNAATGNINLDDADPADTKHYLAFDGLRHVGLVDNTGNAIDCGGAVEFADILAAKAAMIDSTYNQMWGAPLRADDLLIVADPVTWLKGLSALTEVTTVEKFGPQATVLAGQLGRLAGHPVLASTAIKLTEADGKVSTTGANNTKGQIVLFNRNAFRLGYRRTVKIETERIPATDQNRLVATVRLGFGRYSPTGAASGIQGASVLYNITV